MFFTFKYSICFYHVTDAFQSQSPLYSCLNVKERLARNRHNTSPKTSPAAVSQANIRLAVKDFFLLRNLEDETRINIVLGLKNFEKNNLGKRTIEKGIKDPTKFLFLPFLCTKNNLNNQFCIALSHNSLQSIITFERLICEKGQNDI